MTKYMQHNQKGFTLIEILVSVTFLATVVILVTPLFIRSIEGLNMAVLKSQITFETQEFREMEVFTGDSEPIVGEFIIDFGSDGGLTIASVKKRDIRGDTKIFGRDLDASLTVFYYSKEPYFGHTFFYYDLDDNENEITITDYNETAGGINVVIPSTIPVYTYNEDEEQFKVTNITVTSIGKDACKGKTLTSILLPDSVVTIGAGAFQDNDITVVKIGSGVDIVNTDSMGDNGESFKILYDAVTGNNYKAGIFEFDDVTNAWRKTFFIIDIIDGELIITGYSRDRDVTETNVTINAIGGIDIKHIGNYAFFNNELENLVIGDSVKTIGSHAFMNNAITDITIGVSVTSIGAQAFMNNALTSVDIPDSVETIGSSSFMNNTLTAITIGNSVTDIGDNAFTGNAITIVSIDVDPIILTDDNINKDEIEHLVIGDSVETISGGAFQDRSLTHLTIGNSVTDIGDNAFTGNAITKVAIDVDPIILTDDNISKNGIRHLVIGDSVETISGGAFQDRSLTHLTIGVSVTSIGSQAFMDNDLTSVVIPDSVETIGSSAFMGNNSLTDITIGNSVTSIGSQAFMNNALTSVVIPDSVETIGSSAFMGNELTTVTIGSGVTIEDDMLAADNNNFREAYNISGAGIYVGTQSGIKWEQIPD